MPRDGSGHYTYLDGTRGIPGTPVQSPKYNNYIDDIAGDLNAPRPIVAGGTGASSANQALFNLQGEKATQLVTSWDTTLWLPGSFYAATTAIGIAPVTGHAFAGVCYLNEPLANPPTNQNLVLEATDLADPVNPAQYIRIMTAGVWGAWTRLGTGSAAANLGEYTFDSTITFPPASGQIRLNNATQNSATEIFISHIGALGGDNTGLIPFTIKSGSDIIIQDKDEGPKYKLFSATADPVLSGGDFRVTVTFKSGGTDLVSAQRMLVGGSTGGTVLYNTPQTLTTVQQTQARQNVYAAPFDALAYNGMQVNGSMEVSQELGTTPRITNGYVCDGWIVGCNAPVVLNSQSTNTAGLSGFTRGLSIVVSTAQPSLAAGDTASVDTIIEGYRVLRLGWGSASAQSITIGFWTAHQRTGTYSVSARNGAFNRACVVTYTQNVAAVWEYKTVTIPGCTDGTWDISNGVGLRLTFTFACGTTYTAPTAGVWSSVAPYAAAPGQVNGVGLTSDVFRLTGVVVLPGTEAPSAARSPLIMRPYDQELLTCQRYYERQDGRPLIWVGYVTSSGAHSATCYFNTTKRSTPTVSSAGTLVSSLFATTPTILATPHNVNIEFIGSGSGYGYFFYPSIIADARL